MYVCVCITSECVMCFNAALFSAHTILHVLVVPAGTQLVMSAVPRNNHHATHMFEGPSAKQEGAQIRTDSQLQSSVRTPRTSEDRRHPYSCLESHYEEVVTHYETAEVDNDTVNITAYDGLQPPAAGPTRRGLAASTPTRTTYTVVPPKVGGRMTCYLKCISSP